MHRKILLQFFFISLTIIALGDTPGKRAISESKIFLKNIANLKDFVFYWQLENDSPKIISADTNLTIPGSGGRPYSAAIWAVNIKEKSNTDTIFLSNYYEPDYEIIIDTVYGNKLSYSKKITGNNNSQGDGLVANDESEGSNKFSKIIILAGASLIALVLLIWIFIKRKSQKENSHGTGSLP